MSSPAWAYFQRDGQVLSNARRQAQFDSIAAAAGREEKRIGTEHSVATSYCITNLLTYLTGKKEKQA
jgi:hypothetical protein